MGQEISSCVRHASCHSRWKRLPTPVTLSVNDNVGAVSCWWEVAFPPLPNHLVVPIRLKFEVPGSCFLVPCVNKDNVMLSIKASRYTCRCHNCGRGLRCYLQRKSVFILSEVNGSTFAPRCAVITGWIFWAVILYFVSLKSQVLITAQCRWIGPVPWNCCARFRGISQVNDYFPFYSSSILTFWLFNFYNKMLLAEVD